MRILRAIKTFFVPVVGFLVPFTVFAVEKVQETVTVKPGVTEPRDLVLIVKNVANIFAAITLAVAIIMIISAAWGYLTAGGDSEKVSSAHQRLIYGIVGIAVALFAFVAGVLVERFLGATTGGLTQ